MATRHMAPEGTTYRGLLEKRQAIARAARTVFGREGYARASVDAIAAEAGVSKRTIYNHYTDKENLFLSVIVEGATEVARNHARLAERHLRKIVELQDDLVAFSLERALSLFTDPDHWAMVRTINAEAAHIPRAVLEAWLDAGPRAAHRELARYLHGIANRGLLQIEDTDEAAHQLTLLTFIHVAYRSFYGAIPCPESEVAEVVTSGVRAFLRLYRPQAGR